MKSVEVSIWWTLLRVLRRALHKTLCNATVQCVLFACGGDLEEGESSHRQINARLPNSTASKAMRIEIGRIVYYRSRRAAHHHPYQSPGETALRANKPSSKQQTANKELPPIARPLPAGARVYTLRPRASQSKLDRTTSYAHVQQQAAASNRPLKQYRSQRHLYKVFWY